MWTRLEWTDENASIQFNSIRLTSEVCCFAVYIYRMIQSRQVTIVLFLCFLCCLLFSMFIPIIAVRRMWVCVCANAYWTHRKSFIWQLSTHTNSIMNTNKVARAQAYKPLQHSHLTFTFTSSKHYHYRQPHSYEENENYNVALKNSHLSSIRRKHCGYMCDLALIPKMLFRLE